MRGSGSLSFRNLPAVVDLSLAETFLNRIRRESREAVLPGGVASRRDKTIVAWHFSAHRRFGAYLVTLVTFVSPLILPQRVKTGGSRERLLASQLYSRL
jgi:hypothetical protein